MQVRLGLRATCISIQNEQLQGHRDKTLMGRPPGNVTVPLSTRGTHIPPGYGILALGKIMRFILICIEMQCLLNGILR